MTDAPLDIQPALRARNVLVRGGRLTKFKGRVASIAPGLLVVVTAAALFSGGVAQAANECGRDDDNDGVISCNDFYPNGIVYTHNEASEFTLEINNSTVGNSEAPGGVAVRGESSSVGDIAVQMTGGEIATTDRKMGLFADINDEESNADVTVTVSGATVTTGTGNDAHGVIASNKGKGNALSLMEGATTKITTSGINAIAFRAEVLNAESEATATARMTGGEIITHSHRGYGLFAETRGTGRTAAVAEILGGSISTNEDDVDGNNTYGLWAYLAGVTSDDAEAIARMAQQDGEEAPTVTTKGHSSFGIVASTTTLGDVTAEMDGGTINTSGEFAHGVFAWIYGTENTSTATAEMIRGEVETTGDNAYGVVAAISSVGGLTLAIESTAEAKVHVDGGSSVKTSGAGAHGIVASTTGFGAATAQMDGGTVTTTGEGAHGLFAWIYNRSQSGAAVTAHMTGGEIVTEGDGAHGISALTVGRGDASVDMERGTVTTDTDAVGAHGLFATAGSLGTLEDGAEAKARAFVRLGKHAVVTAEGANSDGIRVSGILVPETSDSDSDRVQLGARGFDVDVAGSVEGGTGTGAAIRTMSSARGTITIDSSARVTAGTSGLAIHTVTAGKAGRVTEDDDGTAFIRSAGYIRGDIVLDAGDDTLIVTGGRITGDVYGGAGDNTLTLEGGRFTGDVYGGAGNNTLTLEGGRFTGDVRLVAGDNIVDIADGTFTGGIYGGEGDDTVTIFAASLYNESEEYQVLDGGIGGNDRLTVNGQTISNTTGNFLNWESVTLNNATLNLSGVGRLDTALDIDARSTFRAFGEQNGARTEMIIARDVTNDGHAVFSVQDGIAGDEIKFEGNYTGSGTSTFALDARMDGTDTDRLHFAGNMSGDMEVSISNVGGAGAEGGPLAIDVVTVDGEANGTFTLMDGNHVTSDGEHAVIAGAYRYTLAETDGGWALSALTESGEVNYQPSAPVYDSYGPALLGLNGPASLRNRGSAQDFRSLAWDGDPATQAAGSPLWVQTGIEQITLSEEHSTTGAALDSSLWEMEIGGDLVLSESAAGLLVGGLVFSYATDSTDVSSAFGHGSIDTTGLGLGLSATWYDTRRFYVDGQFTFASYSSDLSADGLGTLTEGNDGTGFAVSIEAGQQLDLGSRLTVIPQAQLSLSSVTFDDFASEARGERVAFEGASSEQLRLGLEFGAQDPGAIGIYGIVNLFHEFGAGSEVTVAGATLTTESEPWAVGFGIGGSYALMDRVDLFGEASYATGLSNAGDTSALSANAGLKVVF